MSVEQVAPIETEAAAAPLRAGPAGLVLPPGKEKSWSAQEGGQELFLACPTFEVLLEGNRGGGKTDVLLMDFAQHVGPDDRTRVEKVAGKKQTRGWGAEWRGILFRRHYKDLEDVVAKSEKWFRQMFGRTASFNRNEYCWSFARGEKLFFRHMDKVSDYWLYHGHAYPWLAWEELTGFEVPDCYKVMFSCCRSTQVGMPRKVRSTTNPYGPGHNWVKRRFRLPGARYQEIADARDERGNLEPPRMAINLSLDENKILLDAEGYDEEGNSNYIKNIVAGALNQAMADAWIEGSWDITSGGMFDDQWSPRLHVLPQFDVPSSWHIDRSLDWGTSSPTAVLWWAESDGSDLRLPSGRVMSTVRGDLFLIREWYVAKVLDDKVEGLRLSADEVAKGIVERELKWGLYGKVNPGPADTQIFNQAYEKKISTSIADDMGLPVRIGTRTYGGIVWNSADKSPGSRKQGWAQIHARLKAVHPTGKPREKAGLFICSSCIQWLRVVPSLPRDDKDMDDIPDGIEDHNADATRYRVHNPPRIVRITSHRRV